MRSHCRGVKRAKSDNFEISSIRGIGIQLNNLVAYDSQENSKTKTLSQCWGRSHELGSDVVVDNGKLLNTRLQQDVSQILEKKSPRVSTISSKVDERWKETRRVQQAPKRKFEGSSETVKLLLIKQQTYQKTKEKPAKEAGVSIRTCKQESVRKYRKTRVIARNRRRYV